MAEVNMDAYLKTAQGESATVIDKVPSSVKSEAIVLTSVFVGFVTLLALTKPRIMTKERLNKPRGLDMARIMGAALAATIAVAVGGRVLSSYSSKTT
jgi:hypothetical protein